MITAIEFQAITVGFLVILVAAVLARHYNDYAEEF